MDQAGEEGGGGLGIKRNRTSPCGCFSRSNPLGDLLGSRSALGRTRVLRTGSRLGSQGPLLGGTIVFRCFARAKNGHGMITGRGKKRTWLKLLMVAARKASRNKRSVEMVIKMNHANCEPRDARWIL